jgi:hypothetical protein
MSSGSECELRGQQRRTGGHAIINFGLWGRPRDLVLFAIWDTLLTPRISAMLSAIPPGHDFILVRGKNFQLRFLETIVRMKKVNQNVMHTALHRVFELEPHVLYPYHRLRAPRQHGHCTDAWLEKGFQT